MDNQFNKPPCDHAKFKLGFTLIEILVSLAIVGLMASVSLPMLQTTAKRQKEMALREALSEIRHAIDAYKLAAEEGRVKKTLDQSGYPPDLETLVEGVDDIKDPKRKRIRFLRRIPRDPFYQETQANTSGTVMMTWGVRSYDASHDNPKYNNDVYDIYSTSQDKGLNGVPYAQW